MKINQAQTMKECNSQEKRREFVPGGNIPRVETKKRECWKFLDWRMNSENDSRVHGQPSFASSFQSSSQESFPFLFPSTFLFLVVLILSVVFFLLLGPLCLYSSNLWTQRNNLVDTIKVKETRACYLHLHSCSLILGIY